MIFCYAVGKYIIILSQLLRGGHSVEASAPGGSFDSYITCVTRLAFVVFDVQAAYTQKCCITAKENHIVIPNLKKLRFFINFNVHYYVILSFLLCRNIILLFTKSSFIVLLLKTKESVKFLQK